ncbi:hypothetical protein CC1G_06297 [Coprinopsis cinerea okayama7|uniref:Carbohydrate kinase PfkB domain-containing protein n=1 Tax=Coprinopsis cinerea (strain Okayama-7 / 130 / ATCC MYA-4618 / FGSC 9003) TaxID=240176 RepID=A8NTF0_COPC7|nr:hypothetical protein CC1G_06297 [Coprinopsis cinerea okayama7\|eukprot:XP_001836212.1 hypothetical protein CC1G_06297 [Coprinopsis cinerea okayama7\
MARLRRETTSNEGSYLPPSPNTRPLRVVAAGTLFQTHTLSIPTHPEPSGVIRAHSVEKTRGGSANLVLSLLAQFANVDAALVASLGGNEEGKAVLKELEREGVNTQYCKIWKDAGVPSAWVLHSVNNGSRSVINHNPLPDITHEDFISLLGPLLAPENYPNLFSPSNSPTIPAYGSTSSLQANTPRPSQTGPRPTPFLHNPNSPAPFDWLHFEGRSVKTTLSNITGLDGLAREKKWRSHCVFSIDVGRRGRQGVEALIPYADVVFLNKHYAQAHSPHYASTPRTFLLSLTSIAPPHCLLVAHWGTEGSAVLSLPTKEYFQSSGWVEEKPPSDAYDTNGDHGGRNDPSLRSVRSGSDFWAGDRSRTPSTTAFTAGDFLSDSGHGHSTMNSYSHRHMGHNPNSSGQYTTTDYSRDLYRDDISQRTETDDRGNDGVVDEVGAHDAFIAGMIFALSRKLCPGLPYTPAWSGEDPSSLSSDNERTRWKLDECLRFATELSGRKARRKDWAGLAEEMVQAGWFDSP